MTGHLRAYRFLTEHLRSYKYAIGSILAAMIIFLLLPVVRFEDPTSTVLEDSKGNLLSARIALDGQWRFPDSDSIPHKYIQSLLYYEDEYFFKHPGINPVSLAKALKRNLKAGRVVSGGSTISMQVVRLSRKGKPRTVTQKLIEIVLAFRLELRLSKDEILGLYASHAPFGGNVVGLDAAAWRYYGRPASRMSWGEAATMAVLPNAPSLIYPGKNQEILLKKRNGLLDKLRKKAVLDSISCELAKMEELPGKPRPLPQLTQHLMHRAELEGHRGERLVTSIDIELQKQAANIVEIHHKRLRQNEIHNAAVLVLDIRERKVIAYIGNTEPENGGNGYSRNGGIGGKGSGNYVDIISAPRSSGSILKPLLYTFMLDEGMVLPNMLVADVPTKISGYSPSNFDRTYSGAVPAGKALVRSLNVPAVRMLREFSLERFHANLKALEFGTINKSAGHYGLTLILGGAEVNLWDLSRVYMGMANSLNDIRENEWMYDPEEYSAPSYTPSGSSTPRSPGTTLKKSSIMSAAAIWQCFETLTELERPSQEGSWESFHSSSPIAWKTGTSFGFRDAWAVGLNPDYLVAVWVGNADGEGRPGLTGVNAAAPLMFDIFSVLRSSSWFEPPYDELAEIEVCKKSGFRAGPDCDETVTQMVPVNGTRVNSCPYHKTIHLDREKKYRVNSSCYKTTEMQTVPWFVLPPVMEWYFKRQNPWYSSLPELSPGCREGNENPMEMIYPNRETRQIFIPRGLDGKLSRVVFEATHRNTGTIIYWHLDDTYLGQSTVIHQMEILAAEGRHTLTLVDTDGNILEKIFELVEK